MPPSCLDLLIRKRAVRERLHNSTWKGGTRTLHYQTETETVYPEIARRCAELSYKFVCFANMNHVLYNISDLCIFATIDSLRCLFLNSEYGSNFKVGSATERRVSRQVQKNVTHRDSRPDPSPAYFPNSSLPRSCATSFSPRHKTVQPTNTVSSIPGENARTFRERKHDEVPLRDGVWLRIRNAGSIRAALIIAAFQISNCASHLHIASLFSPTFDHFPSPCRIK
jgi:hypothetical protein